MSNKNDFFILGLDIGIGSVGWGLIDKDRNVIDAGVRLFPEADPSNNEGRRSFRSTRRLLRRRQHRLDRLKELLQQSNIIQSREIPTSTKPYTIRSKGLYHPLTKDEIAIALIHLAKRRGIHNIEVEEDDSSGNELSTKDQILKNEKLLKDRYVCELQLDRFKEKGEIRGHSNRFKTEDYVKEAKKLLDTQQKHHNEITTDFIDKYIELLKTRREYYEGPGKGSPFGWDEDIEKWYQQMMGRCSYFPEELRAVKESYSAQLFNLLNDLNNLSLNREENTKLTYDEKIHLIDQVFKKYKNPTLKRVAKSLDIEEHDIKGYRITKNGKPTFTTLKVYHDIKSINDSSQLLENVDQLDEIAEIVTMYQSPSDKFDSLEKLELKIPKSDLLQIAQLNYTQTHSLSLKMIHLLLPELLETSKNQMEIITEQGLKPKKVNFEGRTYIPTKQIDDFILSPVVKRAFTQTIRVINAIIKKYGYPSEIVIELAREKNSDDRKKFLNDLQNKNEKMNKEIREKLEALDVDASKGLFNMLKLWHLQDGLCMYSNNSIKINTLVNKPYLFEIDHIIPRSVSFDDSMNNKVLVYKDENQKKSNQTPFQYLSSGRGVISYDHYKSSVLQLAKSPNKMSKKKKEYLLEERDINKYDVQQEFINRNLVDTRYATREIMTTLKTFFTANEKSVKVKSINGSFTNYLRKLWDLNKDRGADFKHHAEDALICAMANHIFETKEVFKSQNLIFNQGHMVDVETGEILQEGEFNAFFTEKINKVKQIKNYSDYKYSHRVDMKPNRQLMDDTLYSTRKRNDEEYVINKLKNIYDKNSKDAENLVKKYKKDPSQFLMYHHDPQTFKKLESIIEKYSEAKNPLHQYWQEEGGYLKKYSKKGNGPIVKSLKYYESKLKEHRDQSYKYPVYDKKVVKKSLKPYRMDVYSNGSQYKFVTVRYNDLKEQGNEYVINIEDYQNKLKSKKIDESFKFLFSLYKNDVLRLEGEYYRLIGVNNDSTNRVELNTIKYNYKDYCKKEKIKNDRIAPTIKKSVTDFQKFNVDVLGQYFINENEKLKMKYSK
ncbi:CRISPR-associated endonuclease, Csn1 family [Pelagirhabdus alkalitolerans]|uniref:CRISPR-associated endonuclease Cas9 n=1 Tax=Pelagirhabdus alkalitolerans TaxID=1612202 RepID=A0A1G6KK68_9BACI|nr:type II CRISPR RNA-guided endonuclease Cas9 [Pelagirhabdus alkalitolerans]SDC30935.1 CRISPR-associated endonuclease, Csn1 family [Pelagirhabdus alkalitolerans]